GGGRVDVLFTEATGGARALHGGEIDALLAGVLAHGRTRERVIVAGGRRRSRCRNRRRRHAVGRGSARGGSAWGGSARGPRASAGGLVDLAQDLAHLDDVVDLERDASHDARGGRRQLGVGFVGKDLE